MQNLSLFFVLTFLVILSSCKEGNKTTTPEKAESADALIGTNLLNYPGIWEAATDEFGSSFKVTDPIVNNEMIDVEFTIARKIDERWPFVELKCLPNIDYTTISALNITYECKKGVTVKLNQKDFSDGGDKSYAHYQFELEPTSDKPITRTILFKDFTQPSWASDESKEIALDLNNVTAIYLVPNIDYEIGETERLIIHFAELK